MPRASEHIDDRTPLNAARIDVAARVGWLLRTHRTVSGLSLRQMSSSLGELGVVASAARLSRIETEGQRVPLVLDGYARVLGRPDGAIRADIDILCRGFSYAPPAVPDAAVRSLTAFDRAYEAIVVKQPSGGDWLEFARQHAMTDGFGLPSRLMTPQVHRLANEVGRGVGQARLLRHEALNQLLQSPYHDLVASVLRETADQPGHQNFYDLTSVLSDHPSPELLAWAAQRLASPSVFQVQGASYALQGMLVAGGLGLHHWRSMVPMLARAWSQAEGDAPRRATLAQVCRALPVVLQEEARDAGVVPPPPPPQAAWTRTRNNPQYAFAASIARAACRRLDHPEEPLLERLLFEACFETRGVRMASSTWSIAGSAFARAVMEASLAARDDCPDQASRSALLRTATVCHQGESVPEAEDLLDSHDPVDFRLATTMIGRAGMALRDSSLAEGLAGDESSVRQTLYCLGMAGDARLRSLAGDASLPATTRDAAGWWLEQGPRILA